MAKIKTNKEYAIKIFHPEFGEFYYSYDGWNVSHRTYIFTKNLSKVTTWKTTKFVEKQINLILSKLDSDKGKIFLSLGVNVNADIKNVALLSRKKYFYPITVAKSKINVNDAIENMQHMNLCLIDDSKNVIKSINDLNSNVLINDFESNFDKEKMFIDLNKAEYCVEKIKEAVNILENFYNDSIICVNSHKTIENYKKDVDIYLDIVDASYCFRALKLKTLKQISE